MLDRNGRIVVVDAGAAFKLRAQGGAKPYGPGDISEVKSFVDPKYGNPAAATYKQMFDSDVWLEQRGGAVALKVLNATAIRERLIASGFKTAEAQQLADTLVARAKLMVTRYNLDGAATGKVPKAVLDEIENLLKTKHGTARIGTRKYNGAPADEVGRTPESGSQNAMTAPKATVEHLLNDRFGPQTAYKLQRSFHNWSGSSSDEAGALFKFWSNQRFGSEVLHHGSASGQSGEIVARSAKVYATRHYGGIDNALAILDHEYALTQYHLRRAFGWDGMWVERGMSASEMAQNFVATDLGFTAFQFNAASSATYTSMIWRSTDARVAGYMPVERILKTYHQGENYFSFGTTESEFLVAGGFIRNPKVKGAPAAPRRKVAIPKQ
jgi:hypothetical protein